MQPLVVRKNDPITMTYENKMLRITANGVATQDGAVGERIGIRNATSQTTIYGVVTGPGAIVVKGRETTSITQNNISATPAGGNHELR
jgi:flagella basal body P-ring formation protein FlgA